MRPMDNRSPEVKQRDAFEAAKAAFGDMKAAQSKATEYGALLSEAATREEIERLTGLFTDAQQQADLARTRFLQASRAYTDLL